MSAAPAPTSTTRRVALVAGKPSHPTMMHEFNAGCLLLQRCLAPVAGLQAQVYANGWPEAPAALDGVDAIFLFMDGGANHAALQEDRLPRLERLIKRGVSLGCAHYAVEVPAEKAGKQ